MARKKEIKEEIQEVKPLHDEKEVVVCPHCGAKVFYEKGTCKWCYGAL